MRHAAFKLLGYETVKLIIVKTSYQRTLRPTALEAFEQTGMRCAQQHRDTAGIHQLHIIAEARSASATSHHSILHTADLKQHLPLKLTESRLTFRGEYLLDSHTTALLYIIIQVYEVYVTPGGKTFA